MPDPLPFMLSYARSDAKKGRVPVDEPRLKAFIELLDERVKQITGHYGFIDVGDIKPGEELRESIAEALSTAQTLVCLYSPAYFESDYCGKEMQVFLERRASYMRIHPGKPPANIIAVAWQSVPLRVPNTLPDFLMTNPNLDPDKRGVYDLGDDKAKVENVVEQIAQSVRAAWDRTPLPPPRERPSILALQSAFLPPPLPLPEFDSPDAKAGPDALTFVYPGRWDALPWAPPKDSAVLYVAASVAKGRERHLSQLTFDPADANLGDRLETLRRRNNVAILLVDASGLAVDALRARIQDYDRPEHTLFAAIVIEREPVPELDARLKESLPNFARRAPPHYQLIRIPGDLSREARERVSKSMAETFERLKLAVAGNPYAPKPVGGGTDFPGLPAVDGPGRPK